MSLVHAYYINFGCTDVSSESWHFSAKNHGGPWPYEERGGHGRGTLQTLL